MSPAESPHCLSGLWGFSFDFGCKLLLQFFIKSEVSVCIFPYLKALKISDAALNILVREHPEKFNLDTVKTNGPSPMAKL